MFSPEGFVTATRQRAALSSGWSLEELELYLEVGLGAEGPQDVTVRGLVLEGARWSEEQLEVCEALRTPLPDSRLRWRRRVDRPQGYFTSLPVYLDGQRGVLVGEVLTASPSQEVVPRHVWVERCVGVVLQPSL
jgi:hypothetical protein